MNNGSFYYIASIILALIPAIVWLSVIFRKTKRKWLQVLIFLGGTLTVIPVFILQYFLNFFPQFDVSNFLQAQIHDQNLDLIILFIGVGIIEELVKQSILRFIDRRYLLIQTINESIQFSLVSALGFSFIENILYIYNIWTGIGVQQLFIAYLFRSIFTTCAHMIFSGFFGYFYGIAKFSFNIQEQSKWAGKKLYISRFIGKIFNMPKSQALKEQMILKGLFIAICMHAIFDFLLQLNQILPVVIFTVIGFALLINLLRKKAGRIVMTSDFNEEKTSTMVKTDEEVVIELIGMWFQEKKFVDVIHVCKRLLERDPENKVVQLFKAQAIDKMDKNNIYSKILQTIFPNKVNVQSSLTMLTKENSTPATETQN